jgi:hypothetical protein
LLTTLPLFSCLYNKLLGLEWCLIYDDSEVMSDDI